MKAKKALKRLTRVETLLKGVLDQYRSSEQQVEELLNSAKTSISQVKQAIFAKVSAATAKKPPAKAEKPRRRRLSTEGRKGISLAAKKRWAAAKRNGAWSFEFISGEGTDPNSRQTWARVKAETEAALFAMRFHDAYALRPGFIQPMRGSTSREGWMRWLYAVTAPFYPFLQKRFGRVVTLTDLLGRGDGAACHHRQREEDPEYSRPERCCKGKPIRIVRRISVHTRGAGIVSSSRNALVRRADTDRCKDRGVRPDREQGAHEHEAKEHDLPLVRQGRA
jgi:hypothetical protein